MLLHRAALHLQEGASAPTCKRVPFFFFFFFFFFGEFQAEVGHPKKAKPRLPGSTPDGDGFGEMVLLMSSQKGASRVIFVF